VAGVNLWSADRGREIAYQGVNEKKGVGMKKLIFLLMIVIFPTVCCADTLLLKSGEKIECDIIEQGSNSVKVNVKGESRNFFKSEIERIVKKEEVMAAVEALYGECKGVKLPQEDQEYQEIQKIYGGIHQAILAGDQALVASAISSGAQAAPDFWKNDDLQLVPSDYQIVFIFSMRSENAAIMRMKGKVLIKTVYQNPRISRNAGDSVNVEGEISFIKEGDVWKIAHAVWRDIGGKSAVVAYRDERVRNIEDALKSRSCFELLK
jgi:hypothetical protein